jgi:formamidopyrimidine-DNA glycosylase
MPELPEVETVVCGLRPHLDGRKIQSAVVRHRQLRWPIIADFELRLIGQCIGSLSRRSKYILMPLTSGTLIVHLGMSGTLRIVPSSSLPGSHDHVDIVFSEYVLRYNDPRRFGAMLWTKDRPEAHPLLKSLGPEPLGPDFTAGFLQKIIQQRRMPIKSLLMNGHFIAGIGNIYATEALFLAKIHPARAAHSLKPKECSRLVDAIKLILQQAIQQGGTTLKDFINSEGKPGYFSQDLQAYGRAGQPCAQCQELLVSMNLVQRSTVYCPNCQK